MDECYNCGFWDSDYEGCTCPSVDKWHACPLEPEPTEEDFMTVEEVENAKAQRKH